MYALAFFAVGATGWPVSLLSGRKGTKGGKENAGFIVQLALGCHCHSRGTDCFLGRHHGKEVFSVLVPGFICPREKWVIGRAADAVRAYSAECRSLWDRVSWLRALNISKQEGGTVKVRCFSPCAVFGVVLSVRCCAKRWCSRSDLYFQENASFFVYITPPPPRSPLSSPAPDHLLKAVRSEERCGIKNAPQTLALQQEVC